MAISGINSNSNLAAFGVRGVEVFKEIRNNVLRITSHKWIGVDKTKLPYRILLPECCSMFINVGSLNSCSEYVPYGNYNNMPTVPFEEVEAVCTCEGGIKDCIQTYEKTEEDVTISSGTFAKTTIKKVMSNGDVYIYTNTPTQLYDTEGQEVGTELEPVPNYIESESYVCNLDLKPCGCVALSQENMVKISGFCCPQTISLCNDLCTSQFNQPKQGSLTLNSDGYYKYSEQDRTVYLYGTIPEQVLINFQTSGEDLNDEQLPLFALEAFYAGMDFYNSRYSKTMNRLDKREYSLAWADAKTQLELKLPRNKMIIDNFDNPSINYFPKWG